MKSGILLLGFVALLNTACSTVTPQNVCRTASVAFVPPENVEAVRVECAQLKASGNIHRGGVYLREIDGKTYLFQYLEVASRDGRKNFQPLEKLIEPLPVAVRNDRLLEPMERIFYEAGAADKTPEGDVMRIAMFSELKPEKEKDYRLLHANPWPDVIAAIKKANFRHFSVFLEEIDGHVYLFGWLEYIGKDIAADDAENKKDPASIRWWKETDVCQIAPPDAAAKGELWGGMQELLFCE